MFTGLIKDIGTVEKITHNKEGVEFEISTSLLHDIEIDDSVATNGVCLTATKVSAQSFSTQAVKVTLEKSNLGQLKKGSKVNLELALRPNDRLGGHFVQGHVNGVGTIKNKKQYGDNWEIEFKAPSSLFKYIINEGSIAIDGISLTVAKVYESSFLITIIPHTYENTIIHTKSIGESVNIEVDMMAKYLENFVKFENKEDRLKKLME
ncbi:MAG: riboflavin synthase [Halobacteriovoraceae bacterium]|nr:riboflavin synthase [Halobacteriovoraceae bacterium]|tara:strand:- start:34871 stop:35491 length:621 start_codon:yes stop_codon:yes gene_type:complete